MEKRNPLRDFAIEQAIKRAEEGKIPSEDLDERISKIEEYFQLEDEEVGDFEKRELVAEALRVIRDINLAQKGIIPYPGGKGRTSKDWKQAVAKIKSYISQLGPRYSKELYQKFVELEDLLEIIKYGRGENILKELKKDIKEGFD